MIGKDQSLTSIQLRYIRSLRRSFTNLIPDSEIEDGEQAETGTEDEDLDEFVLDTVEMEHSETERLFV